MLEQDEGEIVSHQHWRFEYLARAKHEKNCCNIHAVWALGNTLVSDGLRKTGRPIKLYHSEELK